MLLLTLFYSALAFLLLFIITKQTPQNQRRKYSKSQMLSYLAKCTAPPADWVPIEKFKKDLQERRTVRPKDLKTRIKPLSKGHMATLPDDKENQGVGISAQAQPFVPRVPFGQLSQTITEFNTSVPEFVPVLKMNPEAPDFLYRGKF